MSHQEKTVQSVTYFTFFIAVLAIINPISKVGVLLSLIDEEKESESIPGIAKTTAISVAVVLLLSLWFGSELLRAFDLSIGAFTTSGGLIVILLGLRMMQIHDEHEYLPKTKDNINSIAIVPLAIPITAGPGAMAAVILHSYHIQIFQQRLILSLSCIAISVVVWGCLYFAKYLGKILGPHGIVIFSRITGMVTCGMGTQMFALGLQHLFPALVSTAI